MLFLTHTSFNCHSSNSFSSWTPCFSRVFSLYPSVLLRFKLAFFATKLWVLVLRTCESAIQEREWRKLTEGHGRRGGEGFRQILRLCNIVSDGEKKKKCAHVQVCVCMRINVCANLSVDVCMYPCLTLSLLHFMIHVANGPCVTQSPTEREWVGEERPVTPALPITRRESLCVCVPMFASMHECMCADVRMCVGGLSALIQSASMMRVINVCVHTCKRNPLGQQLFQGAHGQRQGRKVMFSDCKCIQSVSARRKRETGGVRHRERERG